MAWQNPYNTHPVTNPCTTWAYTANNNTNPTTNWAYDTSTNNNTNNRPPPYQYLPDTPAHQQHQHQQHQHHDYPPGPGTSMLTYGLTHGHLPGGPAFVVPPPYAAAAAQNQIPAYVAQPGGSHAVTIPYQPGQVHWTQQQQQQQQYQNQQQVPQGYAVQGQFPGFDGVWYPGRPPCAPR